MVTTTSPLKEDEKNYNLNPKEMKKKERQWENEGKSERRKSWLRYYYKNREKISKKIRNKDTYYQSIRGTDFYVEKVRIERNLIV